MLEVLGKEAKLSRLQTATYTAISDRLHLEYLIFMVGLVHIDSEATFKLRTSK